jgi:DNA-binding beta-propeller fold protein YncE
MLMRLRVGSALRTCALAIPFLLSVIQAEASFVTFETGQVRPLALSPDGSKLFAVNTPDNALEIFDVGGAGLAHAGSVPVGLEPCSVAVRSNTEVWVVNHLSDSISIVDVSLTPPRVVRTLLVGDEPRDIVFAGPGGNRAFITTAHRGQNSPVNPQLTTEGVGRADVWVFDATNLGASLGGTALTILTHFGDTPRALAVSPDGNTVYAGVFHSGNRTTAINEGAVCDTAAACSIFGTTMPGGLPPPATDHNGDPRPQTGLIVKFDSGSSQWRDQLARNWNPAVRFSLPDLDVFEIDAAGNPPTETDSFAGVGTILFNMITNPTSGALYVSNTEAINEVRFEGPGIFGGSTVRSHLHEARVTVIDPVGDTVNPRHLNKHINYSAVPSAPGVEDDSLATPLGMAINSLGTTLYVTAFGSSKIGVYPTAALEADTFDPTTITHISLSGGGPTGLALDEANGRLYVLTRFNNAVAVVDIGTLTEEDSLPLHNPEPYHVRVGRPLLYDAVETSSNGEASCSACHVFGDFDSLAWDLGNPDDDLILNPNPLRVAVPGGFDSMVDFHPMKGPMTTQSLRGMANAGPMHWRGDRTGGNDNNGDPLDEDAAFKKFNVAFEGLLGREAQLTDEQMQLFTDFILDVTYPPNPIRALDNSLTPDQQAGRNFFLGPQPSDVFQPCNGCHRLDEAQGFFGTQGESSFENEPQVLKIAHLRNMYQKVGMFGMPRVAFVNSGNTGNQGPQVRGFGYLHDGSIDTVFRFLNATVFNQTQFGFPINPGGFPDGTAGDPLRRQVEQFIFAFDSNMRPMVGQQITLSSANGATVNPRIDQFLLRDDAGDCEVIVKGTVSGERRGAYRTATGTFQMDRAADAPLSDAAVRALAASTDLTYTCAPPGSGYRIGVDRDRDGVLDGDETDSGTDPTDPASTPPGSINCLSSFTLDKPSLRLIKVLNPPGDERITLTGRLQAAPTAPPIDPLTYGLSFRVMDSLGNELFSRTIPPDESLNHDDPGWKVNRSGTRWAYRDSEGLLADGITTAVVIDKSRRTRGLFQFRISGKGADFQATAADAPLQFLVVLGNGVQTAADECGSIVFNPAAGVRPNCSVSNSQDAVRCR